MTEIQINYDEAKVPAYTLPDPLTYADGMPVATAEAWLDQRRPEILTLFEHFVYGRAPGAPEMMLVDTVSVADDALDGLATRKLVTLRFSDAPGDPALHMLVYLPRRRTGPVPLFLGLNFVGNHTVQPDPAIPLPEARLLRQPDDTRSDAEILEEAESKRGTGQTRWPVPMILRQGYGLATIYRGDIDPDYDDGFENGVHGLYPRDDSRGDAWGTISAWAWGLSRALDALEQDADVDATRVAVIGHSRLGKTALWAGATDPRFAFVISNNSGCGGAALSRRRFGESVRRINTVFPHWFCTNFDAFNDNEAALPVDQHELIALIAPRPVYVASSAEDLWADPRGEFLGATGADPVYRLVTGAGLPVHTMPDVEQPIHGIISYHVRSGPHNITPYDWQQYLTVADTYLGT